MIDISFTMILQIINFGILMWVLNKLLYKKLLDYLDRRAEGVKVDLDEASRLQNEAKTLLEQREEELMQAKTQAASIVRNSKKEGEEARTQILARAEQESQKIIDDGKAAVETERKKAAAQLRSDVADVAVAVAEKIVEKSISAKEHTSLVDDVLKKMKSQSWN
ncbi:F0F1 ATP synthase subunit B [bacterium]|nr:F0F1 ATP synthase subunit B [bacterium]MCP5463032.1 F0F1 ATP synthase subunit B [bacterium]